MDFNYGVATQALNPVTEGEIHAFCVLQTIKALELMGFAVARGRKLRNGCIPDLQGTAQPGIRVNVEIRTRLRPGDLVSIMEKYAIDGATVLVATTDHAGALYVLSLPHSLDFPAEFSVLELNCGVRTISLLRVSRLTG